MTGAKDRSEYRQWEFRLTRLDGAGPGTVDWVHTTHQPRSRSPSIVDMLKTRNSWRRLPQNRNRRTTDKTMLCHQQQDDFLLSTTLRRLDYRKIPSRFLEP
jgi:hypothetical protein